MKPKILFLISIIIALILSFSIGKLIDQNMLQPKIKKNIEKEKTPEPEILKKKTYTLSKKEEKKTLTYRVIKKEENISKKEPLWKKNAAIFKENRALKYKIAIVIDDLGLNHSYTKKAIHLPAPINLSFLPYGENLQPLVDLGRRKHHEIMLHLPMEPTNRGIDPGPNAIRSNMSKGLIHKKLSTNLIQFEGYVGINNHMGSKATISKRTMQPVLNTLKQNELIFLDSKTNCDSVCETIADKLDYPILSRDVFLDHVAEKKQIEKQLQQLEIIARKNTYAIGIGHPKQITLDVLNKWIPALSKKGFELVPISFIMEKKLEQIENANHQP